MNSKKNNFELEYYGVKNSMKSNNTIHSTISNDNNNSGYNYNKDIKDNKDQFSTYYQTQSLFYPRMIYNSNQNFVKEYEEDAFIKFTKFLPSLNHTELLIITNNNKIQLHSIHSERENLSEISHTRDKDYSFSNFKSLPTIRSKKIFETKESNYIYDYDM
jgi:hypothetical protein